MESDDHIYTGAAGLSTTTDPNWKYQKIQIQLYGNRTRIDYIYTFLRANLAI